LADPAYCHLDFIDLQVYILDASIEGLYDAGKTSSSWKSVLIGGMGLGGACRNPSDSCTDCVKTPVSGEGHSSYFALDVTYPENPYLLWEFSDSALGYSTAGPAIVRIGNGSQNGKWFVVFASGPTGPINTAFHQFLGRSDQNLKIFILDLKTGALVRTIDTGIQEAFGGSLFNSTIDTERGDPNASGYYSDNIVYLGYTTKDTSTGTWTKGGVLRIITNENDDPGTWTVSKVIDNIGPVTTAVTKLQDRSYGNLWLYFGTGRFFYKLNTVLDTPDTQMTVYGIKEPCYLSTNTINNTCSDLVSTSGLTNQTDSPTQGLTSTGGWYINLDHYTDPDAPYKDERVITDHLAVFSGIVFFTTFSPASDPCALGGNTDIWALNYSTGYSPSNLTGKALLQVSTGEIKELTLGSAFTQKSGRRSAAISGVPPKGQGLSVLISPRPLRRILHIQEK
jgi:type IV pilus assembly protein PilY1